MDGGGRGKGEGLLWDALPNFLVSLDCFRVFMALCLSCQAQESRALCQLPPTPWARWPVPTALVPPEPLHIEEPRTVSASPCSGAFNCKRWSTN